jgi:hypothetical protein
LRRKQASNIPIGEDKAYLQKPAISASSKRRPTTLSVKSWSFWVFVQILGFHRSSIWDQGGTMTARRAMKDSRDAASRLVQIVDNPEGVSAGERRHPIVR